MSFTEIIFSWVTDPNNFLITNIYNNIVSLLENSNFTILSKIRKSLYNGMVENTYIILRNGIITSEKENNINNLISQIKYSILNYNIIFKDFYDESYINDNIKNIKSIITEIIKLDYGITNINIKTVEMVSFPFISPTRSLLPNSINYLDKTKTIILTPYFNDNQLEENYIYLHPDILYNPNLDLWKDYYFISSDPLLNYALNIYFTENNIIHPEDIKIFRGWKLIKKG